MIWLCLWFIVLIVTIGWAIYDCYDIVEKIMFALLCGLLSFLIGGLIAVGLNEICYSPSDELKLEETQKIYSLNDNTYLSGYGGFVSVRIEEEDKYTYMVVNEDGTYSKKTVESENVKIKEMDDCKEPILEVYVCESEKEFWSVMEEYHYLFIVPKGTVVSTFNIDLE